MAASYKFFGINEFTTRLPSALMGVGALLVTYWIGIELFRRKTLAFAASLILGTSVWYVIRVRSGNLDSGFIFFYLLTIFLALKSSRNIKWFPFTMASFGLLIMSKTLAGVSAIVPIVYLNIQHVFHLKKNIIWIIVGGILLTLIVYPWYSIMIHINSDFIKYHIYHVGLRAIYYIGESDKSWTSYLHPKLEPSLFYIHMGVRKWYYLWLGGLASLLVLRKFLSKKVIFLLLWTGVLLYPFLTSTETSIWHLIPVYMPLCFTIPAGLYEISRFFLGYLNKKRYAGFLVLISVIVVAILQVHVFYKEVFPETKYIPDDVAIAKAVRKYNKVVYLDDDFIPVAVFYSENFVKPFDRVPQEQKFLPTFFETHSEEDFIVIARNWAVSDLDKGNVHYKLLEKNNSYSLITNH